MVMDQRVNDILERMRQTAAQAAQAMGKAANVASKKTNELVSSTKVNLQIFELKNDIEALYKEVGRSVYMAHTGEAVDPQEIDGKIAQIDEKVARLSCLQEEPAAKLASRKMPSAVSAASGCNRKTNQEQDAPEGKEPVPPVFPGRPALLFWKGILLQKGEKRCLHTNSIKKAPLFSRSGWVIFSRSCC